jgi:CRP-like cAMP-binding protein
MAPAIIDRLTWILEEEDVSSGETLFSEGDAPECFYFLREGRVQLVRDGSAPRTAEGPAVVGMSDAVLDRARSRTAIVLVDTRIMRVRIDDWVELLDDSFELTRASILSSARRVASLEEQLLDKGIVPWTASGGASQAPAGRRLGVVERLAVLMDALPLRQAGVQTLSDLALVAEERTFEPGDVLFDRGTKRDRVFLVVQGEVAATRRPSDVEWTFGPGHIVCGAAALSDISCAWGAGAKSHVRALAFRIEDWFDLMEEHFDLVRSALAGLVLERERLLELVAKSARA